MNCIEVYFTIVADLNFYKTKNNIKSGLYS